MNNRCPKCGGKIKPTYLKQSCPHCNVNMLYYKHDEQLEADAMQAQSEVDAINRFINTIKESSIKSPLHIIRLILFFTPLASMCLPMFWAGHKNVSLITFIMSIINHGFDLGAIADDKSYLFAILSMVLVIVISIAEIISSLFSSTKKGQKIFIIISALNLLTLYITATFVTSYDGLAKVGLFVTLLIYLLKFILTMVINKDTGRLLASIIVIIALTLTFANDVQGEQKTICPAINTDCTRVISFNVASAFGTGLEDTDSMDRCDRFANYVLAHDPDYIGTQEINSFWLSRLEETMTDYEIYGVKRGGDSEEKNSEMNAIFFKKKDNTVIEKNTVWLSETPNEESKYTFIDSEGKPAEAGCNRICTYAVLENREKNCTYIFLNTHLDNSCEEARIFGAEVILNKIDELQKAYRAATVILTGDFNETADGEACRLLSSKLNVASDNERETATYQEWGYRLTGDKPIDFIFTSASPTNYWVLNRLDEGYISDHYGIYAEIK